MSKNGVRQSRTDWGARLDAAAWWVALSAVFIAALLFTSSSWDSYRLPKDMVVRAATILIAALAAIRWLLYGRSPLWRPDWKWLFAGIVILWTAITALTAQQHVLAAESLLWVISCAVLFLTLEAGLAGRWWLLLYTVLAAGTLNALLCLASMAGWTGTFGLLDQRATGFLGNADDAGSYLSFSVAAGLAIVVASRRRRVLHVVMLLLLIGGLLVTETLGAFGALTASVVAFAVIVAGRRAVVVVAVIVLAATLVVLFDAPLRARFRRWLVTAESGRIDDLLSNRGAGILAALEMARDHPLLGVGPGCYRYAYYDYKLKVEETHPSLAYATTRRYNFGDAHNDHLQTMAQTGLPGYALLLAAWILVARRSFRPAGKGVEGRFARAAAFPLVVAFAVSAMPQFPMELAGPMTNALAIAVLCIGERRDDADD